MTLVRFPGYGAGDLSRQGNLAALVDRGCPAGDHIYRPGSTTPRGCSARCPRWRRP